MEKEEQTGDIEMAWRDVPRGLYRGEWDANKGEISTLDYCGSSRCHLSTKRGALFNEWGVFEPR